MKKILDVSGFMAGNASLEKNRENFLIAKMLLEKFGYDLQMSDFFQGLPTKQALKIYRNRLCEEILSGAYYGVRAFSMGVLLVRSLAPKLKDFDGPIVLIEGPNTASRKLLVWWALNMKKLPLATAAERDMYHKSPFCRGIADSKGLGKVPPLEVHGRWSSDLLTRSAFRPLPYALQANFPGVSHTDLRIDPEVIKLVVRYLDDPIGFII